MKSITSFHYVIAMLCIGSINFIPQQQNEFTETLLPNTQSVALKVTASLSTMARKMVKVYPNKEKKSVQVVAKETNGKNIDFFAFDLEGTLVKHFKMKTGDREVIEGLEKGKYVYSVFAGDEEADNGEFSIQ